MVRTPNNLLTLVSSPKHIKELEDAPNDCLSLAAASKEVRNIWTRQKNLLRLKKLQLFQPKYTMHGFEWADRRGTDGVGFVRVLRSLLTSHLPALLPDIRSAISVGLEEELAGHKNVDGMSSAMSGSYVDMLKQTGLRYSPVLPMIEKVVTKANCVIFFGTQLCTYDVVVACSNTHILQLATLNFWKPHFSTPKTSSYWLKSCDLRQSS